MPDSIRNLPDRVAMFRKQKDEPVRTGASLYRSEDRTPSIPIHARYGDDVADRAAERLNILRSTDRGPFAGSSGDGGAAPAYRKITTVEEHRDPPNQSADVLADRYDQDRQLRRDY